ncbi:MAG TPA: ferrochelatase [Acidimicrobiales bacterium]|nr:ferrochelatase [Acidimicrobiales bacterium]
MGAELTDADAVWGEQADEPTGVLVMAYGTPATPDDVEAYYTHVRRGRPPTPELLDDLRARYEAIGGTSPLLDLTRAQAAGLARALGDGWVVELGMKHAPPFIEDGMARLAEHGARRVVGLVLAPHYSALSVGEYAARAAATEAVAEGDVELTMIDSWHLAPGYVELLATRVLNAYDHLLVTDPSAVEVVFTAHSLPERILQARDPYPDQLRETAEAVAARAGVARWSIAWQSAGRTPEPWIGPDLLAHLAERAQAGVEGVVVCPAVFVSDHLEILYDLDVEARQVAERLGLAFARTESPNDDPAFCATLAQVVTAAGG